MTYIVVFNVGFTDHEVMTNSRGFVEEFESAIGAIQEAEEWIDGNQYLSYNVYEQITAP